MVWKEVEPGEIWKPEKSGDEIVGKLILKRQGQFDNNVYDIKTSTGVKTVFGSVVLDNRMASVEEGTMVKIVFKGLQDSKYGNPTKMFDVFVDDESTEVGETTQTTIVE